jgi:16S rRNA (guanine1207-N2)-methyltransferase
MSQHYYSSRPEAPHRPGTVHVVLPDVHLEIETDAGVFSRDRLDPGTRLLLDTVPAPPASGDLLDLGSGYGPIALVMATRSPGARVWAIDVNERALELCARNAARAGLRNVRCVTPGDPAIPPRFAGIWSNPPVRIGKSALHDLLSGWLGRLAPGRSAYLVAGRNLGADSLHRWLGKKGEGRGGQEEEGRDGGATVARVAARAGYRVLRISYPDDPERDVVTVP